jgi:L-alanine-DL-glutamate epimerase-like enolase superfamily enzyme
MRPPSVRRRTVGAVRIADIRERSVPISRFADPSLPGGGLTTSVVSVTTDVRRGGAPVVGYGFGSFGRYAQGGLIRERFAPRLLAAGDLDPLCAWEAMMAGEKPGGHGERCVAIGALDMALWDAAAKVAGVPLHRHLADLLPQARPQDDVAVYAAGGYRYPEDDLKHLRQETRRFLGLGYTMVKIKVGAAGLAGDLRRIEAVLDLVGAPENLAVDAMNSWGATQALEAAGALAGYGLRWLEDAGDPHDFEALCALAAAYDPPLAAGEALFSAPEGRLLRLHGGLRSARDILVFDPVHCYGVPGFLAILAEFESAGWPRSAFWPHGGHLFCQHLVAALGLGGAEVNPLAFPPFGGLTDEARVEGGRAAPPELPGIGFEGRAELRALLALSLG